MPIKAENKHYYATPEWRALSHSIRFGRAKGRCENCGVPAGQRRLFTPHQGPVILATAHLNHQSGDDRRCNLKALCQECHLKHDRQDNAQRASLTRKLKRWFRHWRQHPTLFDGMKRKD